MCRFAAEFSQYKLFCTDNCGVYSLPIDRYTLKNQDQNIMSSYRIYVPVLYDFHSSLMTSKSHELAVFEASRISVRRDTSVDL
jgi:hypothetical protein